jgi:hypothetical protein
MRVIADGRADGRRSVSGVATSHFAWLQRLPGGSATAMLDELEGYDEEDESDDEAIDDEAAEHLATGDRPRPTVWDFMPQSVKNAGANQQTYGHFGDKTRFESFTKQHELAQEQELTGLSLASPGSVKNSAAAIEKDRAERIEEERRRIEAQQRAEEEEARRIAEEATRQEAERQAKEQQEKASIEAELRNRLQTVGTGGVVIDGWTKLPLAKRAELVADTWKNSIPSEEDIKKFLLSKKKSIKKGSAAEREQKAKNQLPTFLSEWRAAAITTTVNIAQGLVTAAITAEKQANLAADRQILLQAIQARGAAGDVLDLLTRAISQITLSASTDATVEKGFPLVAIRAACAHWKHLSGANLNGSRVSDQLALIGDIWSPGEANDIYWKDRGAHWERTKNLMVKVGNATVNIHIRSGRWTWAKNRGNPPNTD